MPYNKIILYYNYRNYNTPWSFQQQKTNMEYNLINMIYYYYYKSS